MRWTVDIGLQKTFTIVRESKIVRRRPLLQTVALSMAVAGCTVLDRASSTRSSVTDSPEAETAPEKPKDDIGWLTVGWSEGTTSNISVIVRDGSDEAVFSKTIQTEISTNSRHQGFTNVFQTSGEYRVIVRVASKEQTKGIQATLDSSSGWRGVDVYVRSGPEISIASIVT